MRYLLLTTYSTVSAVQQRIAQFSALHADAQCVTVSEVGLVFPKVSLPRTPTAAWRDACKPLVDAVDALAAIDAICCFDERALRFITATRMPKVPLIWCGDLSNLKATCDTLAALRLTTVFYLDEGTTQEESLARCGWEQCDARTLPTFLPSTASSSHLQDALTSVNPLHPAQIEHALRAKTLPFLGGGSRRVCHQLYDSGLCVKCYRTPDEFTAYTKEKVKHEILRYAHHRKQNTSCQEYDAFQKMCRNQPTSILALFPEYLDIIYLPSYGWGLLETLIFNDDQTPAILFPEYLNAHTKDAVRYRAVVKQLDNLLEELCAHCVHFYDFQNVLLQFKHDGTIRLRIADFEPRNRQLIPFSSFAPCLLRRQLRRRYHRTFKNSVSPLQDA